MMSQIMFYLGSCFYFMNSRKYTCVLKNYQKRPFSYIKSETRIELYYIGNMSMITKTITISIIIKKT